MTTKTINEIMRKYEEVKKQLAEIEKKEKEYKQKIIEYMTSENLSEYQNAGRLAKYIKIIQERIDSKALEADYPEIVKEYKKQSFSSRFTFKTA